MNKNTRNLNACTFCGRRHFAALETDRAFADEVKNFSLESEDYNFCLAALSGKILNSAQIIFYIERRLKIELPAFVTNQMLYENLCLILNEIKGSRRREILVE